MSYISIVNEIQIAVIQFSYLFSIVYRFRIYSVTGAFNHMTYELIIENVLDEDYGDFKCKFENSLGSSENIITLKSL